MRNFENEFETSKPKKGKKTTVIIVVSIVVVLLAGAFLLARFLWRSNQPPEQGGKDTIYSDATGVIEGGAVVTLDPAIVYGSTYVSTDSDGNTQYIYTDEDGNEHVVPQAPSEMNRKEGVYTFLLIGLDESESRTDVIMLATYDSVNQTMNVMSIPRDTYSKANDRASYLKHINLAYSNGGIDALKLEVYNLVGYYPDYYVAVDMNGFVEIINFVGGVYFNVPEDMYYTDSSQNLVIDISAGYQWLSGAQALKVCRFRSGYSDADIGRIRTRDAFLKAAAEQILSGTTVVRAAEIAGTVYDNVETNLSKTELVWFAKNAVNMSSENIRFITFPGGPAKDSGMWIPYPNALLEIINESLNPYTSDIVTINVVQRSENYGK